MALRPRNIPLSLLGPEFGFSDAVLDSIGAELRVIARSDRFRWEVYSDYGHVRFDVYDGKTWSWLDVRGILETPEGGPYDQGGDMEDCVRRLEPICAQILRRYLAEKPSGK